MDPYLRGRGRVRAHSPQLEPLLHGRGDGGAHDRRHARRDAAHVQEQAPQRGALYR